MKATTARLMFALALVLAGPRSLAQDFKPYPGARLDEKASRQASAQVRGLECKVYTSSDSFERVRSYYRSLYKEFPAPFPSQKLPNGQEVQWVFFILDGGRDLAHSKSWMKVQRPYIGDIDSEADFKDVRDITVIQTVSSQ